MFPSQRTSRQQWAVTLAVRAAVFKRMRNIMKFLKENSVAGAGILVAVISTLIFFLRSKNLIDDIFWFYLLIIGIPYSLAISVAAKNLKAPSSKDFIIIYTLFSQLIYLSVFSIILQTQHWLQPNTDLVHYAIGFGIPSGIGAVLMLLLTKNTLKLDFKSVYYFIFFISSILLQIVAFSLDKLFSVKLVFMPSLWQIGFALAINEIIKRQEESFKTNSQKANSF